MSISIKVLFLASIMMTSLGLKANSIDTSGSDLIYGADNRYEVDDYTEQEFIDKANSVAIRVSNYRLFEDRENHSLINFPKVKLKQIIPQLCENERFTDQISVGNCTGFLVAPNKLVTAGHCIMNESDCASNKWIFGYKEGVTAFKKADVYSCKRIIAQKYIYTDKEVSDYAVIELDKPVVGRTPLTYRKRGIVHLGAPLLVIGHPLGLPMKIADGARVTFMNDQERKKEIQSWLLRDNYFTANLDSYGGNSGSPVFNRKTGKVEGILIQGADDFVYNRNNECLGSKHLTDSSKNTYEKVMRITKVSGLKD